MAFPEFETGRKSLLFFSRGRGRGHAVPDIDIHRAMTAMRSDIEMRFVSYGTGGQAFESAGIPFIDLGLPDAGGVVDTTVLAGKLIAWLRPDLVVSHEEFPALPVAKIFDSPTLLLTDWFLPAEGYATNTLKYADQILFLGEQGLFPGPPGLTDRIRYLGPIIRTFVWQPEHRSQARRELGMDETATVVSVFPGSWPEEQTPLLQPVLDAFDALPGEKHLIWLAGSDYEGIRAATVGRANMVVLRDSAEIDRLMVATDVAITKTNRKTVFELHSLRVRTIAVTFGVNPADDIAVAALSGIARLPGNGLTGSTLHQALVELLKSPAPECLVRFCTTDECARMISELVLYP